MMDYNTIMIPVIAAVFIFNFTAINSLLQDFYKKYNSILLLKEILNIKIIFKTIIIPGFFVILFIFLKKETPHLLFFSVLSIIYCIGSSIWLINQTKYLLNQNRIITKLLAEINTNEIEFYKNHDILNTENRIDVLLKIIISFIRSNDFNSAEDIFNILFQWVDKNLDVIKSNSDNHWAIKSNRFYRFFYCITDEVCKSRNTIIQDTIITSIYNQIIINSKFENISNYEYIYTSLSKFIETGLLYEKLISNSILNKALKIMLQKIPMYLYESKISDEYDINDKSLYLLHESKDFKKLNNTLYEKIDSIISIAAEKNNTEFLKSINLFFYSYRNPQKVYDGPIEPGIPYSPLIELSIPWNVNYYQFLNLVTGTYRSLFYKIKDKDFNFKLWNSIISDYRNFMYHFKEFDSTNKIHKAIYNTFYSSYRYCLYVLIEKEHILNYFDFYDTFCDFKHYCSNEQEVDFIKLFIEMTELYFKYFFNKENDKYLIYQTWSRVLQFQENHSESLVSKELNDYIQKIEKKYEENLKGYSEWKENLIVSLKDSKKQLDAFWD